MLEERVYIGDAIDYPPPFVPCRATVSGSRQRYEFDSLFLAGFSKTWSGQICARSAMNPDEGKAVLRTRSQVVDDSPVRERELLGHDGILRSTIAEKTRVWDVLLNSIFPGDLNLDLHITLGRRIDARKQEECWFLTVGEG